MTSIIHTLNSVYEIDYDESLFRRVWSSNDVLDNEIWFPFVKVEKVAYPGGLEVFVFVSPSGGHTSTSRILT